MSKSKSLPRVFSREFKLTVVRRMLAGENVSALARELKVLRKDLYAWRDRFRSGGPEALRGRGRPRKAETAVRAASGKNAGDRAAPIPTTFRTAPALPSWSARSASSRSNSIFFDKPCGRSREHAGRATGLA
jgi:transposase-like protein